MKKYEAPELALIKFNTEDVITTSIGILENLDPSGTEGPIVGMDGIVWNSDNGLEGKAE